VRGCSSFCWSMRLSARILYRWRRCRGCGWICNGGLCGKYLKICQQTFISELANLPVDVNFGHSFVDLGELSREFIPDGDT
jgi:hypothetical protein